MKSTASSKSKTPRIIPVFFAVDDNYVPYLAIALRSLIDNASPKYDYRIHILIDTLEEKNRQALLTMQTEYVHIEFVSVSGMLREMCTRLHIRDYYTQATYYRFFVPEIFPQYDRGVYLDCDIVLTADVAELYRCHMGQNLVAAATDEVITDVEVFARYSEQVLHIPREEYFNAGILVMNLRKMREVQIKQQFADLLSVRTYPVAQDQDYLNKLCYGRTYRLSEKWNKTPMPDSDRRDIPKIVHFKINFKPWRYDNIPYAEVFWSYAEKTPYYRMLQDMKADYTEEERNRDSRQYASLMELAEAEIAEAAKTPKPYDEALAYAQSLTEAASCKIHHS